MSYQNVLLIDDDPDDREIFVSAMEMVHPSARYTSRSALEALEQLTQMHVKPDMIFLDLNMPIMNGLQFLKVIKANTNFASIPVIVLSTSSHLNMIQSAKDLGGRYDISRNAA